MKIRIICVGQKMPEWVQTGFNDYLKRIQPFISTEIVEVATARRGKHDSDTDILRMCQQEGQAILAQIKSNDQLIALEVNGKSFTTEKLASKMQVWMQEGQDIVLAIGGPDGLSDEVRQRASWYWSISDLTLPHPLVRIVLMEQLYRAMSVINNHPYHRA